MDKSQGDPGRWRLGYQWCAGVRRPQGKYRLEARAVRGAEGGAEGRGRKATPEKEGKLPERGSRTKRDGGRAKGEEEEAAPLRRRRVRVRGGGGGGGKWPVLRQGPRGRAHLPGRSRLRRAVPAVAPLQPRWRLRRPRRQR